MNFVSDALKAFRAEWIKLRRSGIPWLIFGMSAFIPLLFTLIQFFSFEQAAEEETDAWESFLRGCYTGFAGFFFPIYLVLITSRLAQVEHRNAGWKLIETQPIRRIHLFLAKWKVAMILSLFCLLGVLIFGLIGATLLSFTPSGESLRNSSIDLIPILSLILRLWIASLGILAIQYFLAIWVPNFLFSFGIGLVAIITASIFAGFNKFPWFPYSATIYTIRSPDGNPTGSLLLHHEWLSIAWMALFLWIGYHWYRFKSWKFAFTRPRLKPLAWLAVIVAFAFAFYWIEQPQQLDRYGKAVIAGKLETSDSVRQLALVDPITRDSIITISVRNGRFHYSADLDLPLSQYYLTAGRRAQPLIFSGEDSLHIDWEISRSKDQMKITGTRTAENEHFRSRNDYSMDDYQLEMAARSSKPERYAKIVHGKYNKAMEGLKDYRTVGNLKPSDDYINMMSKLVAIKHLRLLDFEFPRQFASYNPNDTLRYPESVDKFREKITTNDSSLINFPEYTNYLSLKFHNQLGLSPYSKDPAYVNYLVQNTEPGKVRDLLIFQELKSVLTYVRDSLRRNLYLQAYLPELNSDSFRKELIVANERLNKLARGKPLPQFSIMAMNEEGFNLNSLRGKYLVIDIWATWCGPCKEQDPYFEDLASQYTNDKVAFVSISIDENKNAWKSEAPGRSKRVLQLWATDHAEMSASLAVEFIPRFMLIDPNGKIIEGQMPMPSDPAFEEILLKEIKALTPALPFL